MVATVPFLEAWEHLAELWDRAVADGEPIRIVRDDGEAVILVSGHTFDGLLETIHLLKSPTNAARLYSAIERARQ